MLNLRCCGCCVVPGCLLRLTSLCLSSAGCDGAILMPPKKPLYRGGCAWCNAQRGHTRWRVTIGARRRGGIAFEELLGHPLEAPPSPAVTHLPQQFPYQSGDNSRICWPCAQYLQKGRWPHGFPDHAAIAAVRRTAAAPPPTVAPPVGPICPLASSAADRQAPLPSEEAAAQLLTLSRAAAAPSPQLHPDFDWWE